LKQTTQKFERVHIMNFKDDYSFESVKAADPSAPVVAEAVPAGEGDEEHPSDIAIIVGMGLIGWVIG
jgi:hypothetical protein